MNMERQTSNLQFEDRPSLRKKMMFLHKSEVLMSTSEPSDVLCFSWMKSWNFYSQKCNENLVGAPSPSFSSSIFLGWVFSYLPPDNTSMGLRLGTLVVQ